MIDYHNVDLNKANVNLKYELNVALDKVKHLEDKVNNAARIIVDMFNWLETRASKYDAALKRVEEVARREYIAEQQDDVWNEAIDAASVAMWEEAGNGLHRMHEAILELKKGSSYDF